MCRVPTAQTLVYGSFSYCRCRCRCRCRPRPRRRRHHFRCCFYCYRVEIVFTMVHPHFEAILIQQRVVEFPQTISVHCVKLFFFFSFSSAE